MKNRVLVINPGSTSTKIAIYDDNDILFEESLRHKNETLANYKSIIEQYEFRKNAVIEAVDKQGISLESLTAIVGRGGFLKPLRGGTYRLEEKLFLDLKEGAIQKNHASNLAGMIAYDLGNQLEIPGFIVDPPSVDEMMEIAKVTGIQSIERVSMFHALNQKAVGRIVADQKGKDYFDCNFIVAHIGGGISVGTHLKGNVIDVNNALDGDGPFSPERAGAIPNCDLINLCFSGQYTKSEVKKQLVGKGGLVSHLNMNDLRDVEQLIKDGDKEAKLVYEAMAYQISKEIGASAAILEGDIDGIIITGGIAYSQNFVSLIKRRVSFLGDVIVIPGEDELNALVQGGLRVLNGTEEAMIY